MMPMASSSAWTAWLGARPGPPDLTRRSGDVRQQGPGTEVTAKIGMIPDRDQVEASVPGQLRQFDHLTGLPRRRGEEAAEQQVVSVIRHRCDQLLVVPPAKHTRIC